MTVRPEDDELEVGPVGRINRCGRRLVRVAEGSVVPSEPAREDLLSLADLTVDELVGRTETGSDRVPPRRHRRWVLPLRLLASVAMLWLLSTRIPDFEWSSLIPTWSPATWGWLAGAAGLTLIGIVLSALRWQQVLLALGLQARLGKLVSLYFAGQFVSNVLPTTIGGDVLRVSRLSRENGDIPDTFASVVLERLTGWLVLPLITFAGLAVNPGLRELGRATLLAVLIAAGTLTALVLVLIAADHPALGGRFRSREGWLRFVSAVHLGVSRLRHHPAAALNVVGVGLLYQLVLCLAAMMAAEAVGLTELGLTPLLAFFPAVLIAQVLPIGISGLGVREGAFVIFLAPLGVPAEQAVALGLLLYLLNVAVSLLGAPAFAVGGKSQTAVAT